MIQVRRSVFETNSSATDVYIVPLDYNIPKEVILGYDDEDNLSEYYSMIGHWSERDKEIEKFFCWLRDCGVKKIYIRDKYVKGEVQMDTLPKDKGETPNIYWLSDNRIIGVTYPSSANELAKAYLFGDSRFVRDTSRESTRAIIKQYKDRTDTVVYEV